MTTNAANPRSTGPARDPDSPPRDLGRVMVSTRIADSLQEQILSGELAPQTRLPAESELAAELGVSRTAVRDAMRTLATRGLVTVRHGHGMTVAAPSDAAFAQALVLMLLRSDLTVGDLITARAQIEIEICSAAAERAAAADVERLAEAIAAFRAAVTECRWADAAVLHVQVHLALLTATRYPALDIVLRPMQQVTLLSSHTPRVDEPKYWEIDAHEALLEGVRSGQRELLRTAVIGHYQVMEADEYSAQRAGLVRESPGMHQMLADVLRDGLPEPQATAREVPR